MNNKNNRVILHCDINYCYAQIEEMLYPPLKLIPFAIGGDEKQRHGIVLARNLLAKPFKLRTGEPLRDALKKCPSLYIVPPRMKLYQYYTDKVKDIYREYSDCVESFGLDEAWIDVTHSQNLFGDGYRIAKTIQDRVLAEIGLTISIGISFNKVFAKLGSDIVKPSGLVLISRENYREVAWKRPIEELLMVGRKTQEKLNKINIYTIGDLANTQLSVLEKLLGKVGVMLYAYANGAEYSEVQSIGAQETPKSVGNSWTTPKDLNTISDVRIVLERLSSSVASRLRDIELKGNVITVSIRNKQLHTITRQHKQPIYTDMSNEILHAAMALVNEHYDFSVPIRSIGVTVSNLQASTTYQLNFFEDMTKRDKTRKVEITTERIRDKFGFQSITNATSLIDRTLSAVDPKRNHTVFPIGFLKSK